MAPWRAKARRRVFGSQVLLAIGQYPLEIGLAFWGVLSGIGVLTGTTPQSSALRVLPDSLEILWASLMSVAAITVLVGLVMHRLATLASGMYLFATTLVSFAVAVVSASDWNRGGVVATLLAAFGVVSLLRGWWLKEQELELIKEIARTKPGTA